MTFSVLLTGFEPFDGAEANPSWGVVQALSERASAQRLRAQQATGAQHEATPKIAQAGVQADVLAVPHTEPLAVTVHTALLPVEFGRAGEILQERIRELSPDLVISVGLAGGTEAVRLERVAINLRDARIPDNAGNQPVDAPVVPAAEGALFTTLPVKAAYQVMQAEELPVTLSLSAGTYVCNDIMYSALHAAKTSGDTFLAGFVHVPDLYQENPTVTMDQAVDAVDILLWQSLIRESDDLLPAGTLH